MVSTRKNAGPREQLTLLHCLNLVRFSIRDFNGELLRFRERSYSLGGELGTDLFNSHNNLHSVQTVETQVAGE